MGGVGVWLAGLVLAGTLAGCGDDGGAAEAPPPAAPSAPAITTQPLPQSVADGASAVFSVTASGSGLGYQWQRNGVSLAGATAATLNLAAVALTDDGARFRVVVSGGGGNVTSNEVLLTVTPVVPTITTGPAAASVVAGQTASFSAAARGSAPLAYQWLRDGGAIAGATGASYTTPALAAADNGARFSVRVSNAAGAVTSAEAVLTVTGAPTGLGSLAASGSGVTSGHVFAPDATVPKSGVPPVIWAAEGGLQQLSVTLWFSGGVATGVSITGPGRTLGVATGVISVNCNVGGTPSGCDFAALRISVDETARTLRFDNSPIALAGGGTVTVSGVLRW